MKYLLDTNVVCEVTGKQPDPTVMRWISDHSHECMLSCVTIGEIWKGVLRLPEGKRKRGLSAWTESLETDFSQQILQVDLGTMKHWGAFYAHQEAIGFNMDVMDSLIAASAIAHQLTLVTRNTGDFPAEVKTLNPWLG